MVPCHFISDCIADRYHMTTELSTLVWVGCSTHTCRYRGVKSRSFEVGRPRVNVICIALHAMCRYFGGPSERIRYPVNSVVWQLLCVKRCEREYRRCWLCSGLCQRVLFLNVKFHLMCTAPCTCICTWRYTFLLILFVYGISDRVGRDGLNVNKIT
jgi:hypothetical protein